MAFTLRVQSSCFFSPPFHCRRARRKCMRRPPRMARSNNENDNGNSVNIYKNELAAEIGDVNQLRKQLKRRAETRRIGLRVAAAMISLSGGTLLVRDGILPSLLLPVSAFIGVALTQYGFVFDNAGELYVRRRANIPRLRRTNKRRSLEVRETGDGRGRGVFAAVDLDAYTALGFYQGELLDTAEFITKYQRLGSVPEYAIAVDSEHVIDGSDKASARNDNVYTPALMNHTSEKQLINVGRIHQWRKRRVMFYTTRAVKKGEEVRFDYGKDYWSGRRDLEVK